MHKRVISGIGLVCIIGIIVFCRSANAAVSAYDTNYYRAGGLPLLRYIGGSVTKYALASDEMKICEQIEYQTKHCPVGYSPEKPVAYDKLLTEKITISSHQVLVDRYKLVCTYSKTGVYDDCIWEARVPVFDVAGCATETITCYKGCSYIPCSEIIDEVTGEPMGEDQKKDGYTGVAVKVDNGCGGTKTCYRYCPDSTTTCKAAQLSTTINLTTLCGAGATSKYYAYKTIKKDNICGSTFACYECCKKKTCQEEGLSDEKSYYRQWLWRHPDLLPTLQQRKNLR